MSIKVLVAEINLPLIIQDSKGIANDFEYLIWQASKECMYIYQIGKFQNKDYFETYEDFIDQYEKTEVCPYVKLKVVFL
jgi:hypothetical protein